MNERICPIHGVEFFKTPKMKGYAHPVKDASGNNVYRNGKQVWCNEDELESAPPAPQQSAPQQQPTSQQPERKEWAPNPEKQASIEAQNARTNLSHIYAAELQVPESQRLITGATAMALVSQLCSFAGIHFDGAHTEKGGHVVAAAKEMGAVDRPVKTLGELRTKLAELGLTDQDEQKAACGLTREEPWSNLKGDYVGAYKIAKETISPAITG